LEREASNSTSDRELPPPNPLPIDHDNKPRQLRVGD
jgi:hypothetical protein